MAQSRKTSSEKTSRTRARKTSTGSSKSRSRKTPEKTSALSPGSGRWVALTDLCGLLTSVYLLAALATWSPLDPSFNRAGSREVGNAAGPVGAYLADFLLQTVGYGAWTVAGLGMLFFVRLTGRRPAGFSRLFGAVGLFWVILCVLALSIPMRGMADFAPGGMIGLVSTETLLGLVGEAGAWIGLAGATAVSLTLGMGVHWEHIVGRAASGVGTHVPAVASSGASLGRQAVDGAAGLKEAFTDLWRRDSEADWTDETGYWEEGTGDWSDETGAIHTSDEESRAYTRASTARAPSVVAEPASVAPARRRRSDSLESASARRQPAPKPRPQARQQALRRAPAAPAVIR